MKCLSIKQPWAGMIMAGIKSVENRTWRQDFYRGPLLVHASKTEDKGDRRYLASRLDRFPDVCEVHGAILGVVALTAILYPNKGEDDAWRDMNQHGWIMQRPVIFAEPVPYKGRLGVYGVPDRVIRQPVLDMAMGRLASMAGATGGKKR